MDAGYNSSLDFNVSLKIDEQEITPDLTEEDIGMKVFTPSALTLISGDKNWKGTMNLELNKKFSSSVAPTLMQNLIYDIEVVIISKAWIEPLIIIKSFYLEDNRGVVFEDNIISQLCQNPWLMEAIGASETNIADMNGVRHRSMSINVDKLQPPVEDGADLQEARPNKLYQE